MSFAIDIKGLAPLLDALERWPDIVRPILEETADAALLSLIPDLADYPPKPAGSTYRRSGTLGRLWTSARPEFAPLSSGFEARIGNRTPYGVFVQGEWQTKSHREAGWKTDEDIVTKHQAELESYFEQALERVVEAVNGAT